MKKADLKPVLWWIRRDLRINHNKTLQAALMDGKQVIPVFILDEHLLNPPATNRQRFLFSGLRFLDEKLRSRGSGLVIRRGNPGDELRKIMQETGANIVFAEEDYSPFSRKRDGRVAEVLPLQLVTGLTVFHPMVTLKSNGLPYTIFTPFSKNWKSLPLKNPEPFNLPENFPKVELPWSERVLELDPLPDFPAGELEAINRLESFLENKIGDYQLTRDRMDLDGTSTLSPYFKFGMLSVQQVVNRISSLPKNSGVETWMNELIWREFYQSILYHFPEVTQQSFNPKLRQVAWRNAPADLQAWKDGLTGYPVVDAAMRQLRSTGWMHNRARMITASFLTKDLLINWQEGEKWFMQNLVDGDIAANNGGWQWSAGTGTDAAPYFRIFNPVLQSMKFDPFGKYIQKWVPELQRVPKEWIHEPWRMPDNIQETSGVRIGRDYPTPIVDHQIVKQRTLAAYKTSQP
jgi:deoxyribodipyrimidine photo-lyase